MATYSELVSNVRDWSNRDTDVVSNKLINTFIQFATDNIYRDLRVAPLEEIVYYGKIDSDSAGGNELPIPVDAIELIQLRKKDSRSETDYVVYAAKADVRSFYQEYTTKYDECYYTREKGNLLVYPELKIGDEFELFYYARRPATNARYTAQLVTPNEDPSLTPDSSYFQYGGGVDTDMFTTKSALMAYVEKIEGSDVFEKDPSLEDKIVQLGDHYYLGKLTPNWLRDQNMKLILFGALVEMFQYLNEPESMALYAQRFTAEIARLNEEENKRKYMGGNIQTHYQSHLI